MLMIRSRSNRLGRLVLAFAVGLVLLGAVIMAACTDDQEQPATSEPQPTATTAAPTTSPQPTRAAQSPTAAPATTVPDTPTPSGPPVQVVTTTNFVADWARVVGGDRVEVYGLLPTAGDPHTFVPGARDVARVESADVVFTVGLGLEAEWLTDLLHNASSDESKVVALGESVDPIEFSGPDPHGHGEEEDGHMEHEDEHEDEHHEEMFVGRLLVADAAEAHLSVIDLSTDEVDGGIFEVAAPRATVYPSPTHRYGIVLARGPEDGDDRVHIFDGGVFLVEHGDHYDLVSEPVSRHSLEIAEERPIHYVNSHGWTAIFADTRRPRGPGQRGRIWPPPAATMSQYVLEAGIRSTAQRLVISDDHVIVSTNNPGYAPCSSHQATACPLGVEVRDVQTIEVVYDASQSTPAPACTASRTTNSAPSSAAYGPACFSSHELTTAHYEHEIIPYPPEMGEAGEFAIGSVLRTLTTAGQLLRPRDLSSPASECFADLGGIWMVDVEHGEMREVFPDPIAAAAVL